jgi:inorganic triphosphatase YgiF
MLNGIEPRKQLLVTTYYDTPDNRLRRERIVVRFRQVDEDYLLAVKTSGALSGGLAQRGEWEVSRRAGQFDFSHVSDQRIRGLVESARDELQAVFTTQFRRNAWMLEPIAGTRVELALDRGWIDACGQREPIREIELELHTGKVTALFDIARKLQETVPLHPEVSSKSERAYRLLLGAPTAAVKASLVPISAGMSTIEAFRLIALSCVSHLQSNEKGVCDNDQPEFVHQARVAVRRLRSAIRLWEPILPEEFVARFESRWQDFAGSLGDARNWDVFFSETLPTLRQFFPTGAEIDSLTRHAQRRCRSCRRAVKATLKSTEYSRLLLDFTAAVLALPESDAGKLEKFVPRCLNKRAKRVNERAELAVTGDVAARHRLRVAFKQLRYALEFFTTLLTGPTLPNYHHSATALQELLGTLNDLAVATQLVAEALPGKKGQAIEAWLLARGESLLPELATVLGDFQHQEVPWK